MRIAHAFETGFLIAVACFSCAAQFQTPPSPAKASPQKAIDIGAAEAPLNDTERAELQKATAKHNYADEKAVIDRALTAHPNSFELLIMAGRLAYLERVPKDAADALERADKIKSIAEPDRLTLALAYQFSGKPEQSRAELVKLTKLAPKNAEYQYLLGRMDRQNQHLEDAALSFEAAIRLDPNYVRAYQDLGEVQEGLNRVEDARKTYAAGALQNRRVASRGEWPPLNYAIFLLKQNDLEAAEKLAREALQYKPRFGWGHYYMGQIFQKQGRNSEAVTEYKEAVVDTPTLRQAWLALGRELTREGNKVDADKALAIFKKLEAQENLLKGRKN